MYPQFGIFFVNTSIQSRLLWCSNSLVVRLTPVNGAILPMEIIHQRPYYQDASLSYCPFCQIFCSVTGGWNWWLCNVTYFGKLAKNLPNNLFQ